MRPTPHMMAAPICDQLIAGSNQSEGVAAPTTSGADKASRVVISMEILAALLMEAVIPAGFAQRSGNRCRDDLDVRRGLGRNVGHDMRGWTNPMNFWVRYRGAAAEACRRENDNQFLQSIFLMVALPK